MPYQRRSHIAKLRPQSLMVNVSDDLRQQSLFTPTNRAHSEQKSAHIDDDGSLENNNTNNNNNHQKKKLGKKTKKAKVAPPSHRTQQRQKHRYELLKQKNTRNNSNDDEINSDDNSKSKKDLRSSMLKKTMDRLSQPWAIDHRRMKGRMSKKDDSSHKRSRKESESTDTIPDDANDADANGDLRNYNDDNYRPELRRSKRLSGMSELVVTPEMRDLITASAQFERGKKQIKMEENKEEEEQSASVSEDDNEELHSSKSQSHSTTVIEPESPIQLPRMSDVLMDKDESIKRMNQEEYQQRRMRMMIAMNNHNNNNHLRNINEHYLRLSYIYHLNECSERIKQILNQLKREWPSVVMIQPNLHHQTQPSSLFVSNNQDHFMQNQIQLWNIFSAVFPPH